MENHQEATIEMLGSDLGAKLNTEQRLLAIASLSPKNAAIQLVQSIPLMNRPLTQEELVIITSQINEPKVLAKFKEALSSEKNQLPMLNAMLVIDPTIAANPVLASEIRKTCQQLITSKMTTDCLCSNLLPNSD